MLKKKSINSISEQDKKLVAIVKMKIPAKNATAKEPVGPALGQYGIPITDFCKNFNELTAIYNANVILFTELYYYNNKTSNLIIKTPPLSYYILKSINFKRGSRKTKKLSRTSNSCLPIMTNEMLFELLKYHSYYTKMKITQSAFKSITHQLKSIGVFLTK